MSEDPKTVATQAPTPRGRSSRAAGIALLEHVSRAFQRAGFVDPGFLLHWPEIAGPHIARVAQPVKWQEAPGGAVMTLCCEPGAAVLLQHETRTLMDKCNSYLGPGRIARFKFVTGAVSAESAIPPHPAPDSNHGPGKTSLNAALEKLQHTRARLARRH
ncbi:MAG TPA: DciA family protein [Micropepsaceae bacterium]|nr:DciA family protein [Micropepsaceae bacterium]